VSFQRVEYLMRFPRWKLYVSKLCYF